MNNLIESANSYFVEDQVNIPRQLYHGSQKEFSEFDLKFVKSGEGLNKYGLGIYLTNSEELAEYYANNGYVYTVNVPSSSLNIYDWDEEVGSSLYESVIEYCRNNGKDSDADQMQEEFDDYGDYWSMNQLYDWITAVFVTETKAVEVLQECGCDGTKANDIEDRGEVYVVFDANRLKILDVVNLSSDSEE